MAKKRIARDVNGKPLAVGDTVRKVEFGSKAIHRLVQAVGDPTSEQLAGYVMVTSSIAWEHGRSFEKIYNAKGRRV